MIFGYICGVVAWLALLWLSAYVIGSAWFRARRPRPPAPKPNPLAPGHNFCGDTHCDPCNRADRGTAE